MFKKILFYGVTLVLGIMLMMTSYYGFYVSHNQGMTVAALESNDYDKLAEIFIPFFNTKNALEPQKEEKFEITAYEAVFAEKTTITIDNEEKLAYRYQDGFVFFVNNITYNLEGESRGEDDPVINYSGLKFYNTEANKTYTHTLNDPVDAKDEKQENLVRFQADAANKLKFFEVDLSSKIINETLGGKVDKIEILGGQKDESIAILDYTSKPFEVKGRFFDTVKPLITTYDECLKANDGKRFQEFFQGFLADYNNKELNPDYAITLDESVRRPASIYIKTGAVMLVFIVLAIVAGYFLFRKKNQILKPYEVDKLMEEVKAEAEAKEKEVIDAETVEEITNIKAEEALDEPQEEAEAESETKDEANDDIRK